MSDRERWMDADTGEWIDTGARPALTPPRRPTVKFGEYERLAAPSDLPVEVPAPEPRCHCGDVHADGFWDSSGRHHPATPTGIKWDHASFDAGYRRGVQHEQEAHVCPTVAPGPDVERARRESARLRKVVEAMNGTKRPTGGEVYDVMRAAVWLDSLGERKP